MVIVETSKEFENFGKEFNKVDSIVIPIECDLNSHPKDTLLCLLYVKTISENSKEYILPFRHSDALNLETYMIDSLWTTKMFIPTIRKNYYTSLIGRIHMMYK